MKILLLGVFLACTQAQNDYLFEWHDSCGQKFTQDFNIIGGDQAEPNDYPWMVSIQGQFGGHFCGGSIITPDWVLTAAHCVDSSNPGSLVVVVGEHDLGDNTDVAQTFGVSSIIVHPDWAPFTFNNDIALLELSGTLDLDENVRAICAPNPDDDYTGDSAIVAGWGNISPGPFPDYPDELYFVEVPVISNTECLGDYPGQITDNMVCAGDRSTIDSCQGDSGGPLWYDDGGFASQIGIVSWGIGCADGYPGVYARTSQYIDWVSQQIS